MNFRDNIPIFMQIARMVEGNILSGEWTEGQRVASTRELAVDLSVNPATVMRAYEYLTDLGLIRQQRGLGYFVAEGAAVMVKEIRRREFFEHTAPEFFERMDRLGITLDEIVQKMRLG